MAADKICPHNHLELQELLRLAGEAKSLLEIGSRYGQTLRLMADRMGSGRVVSVDLPNVFPWGEDSQESLIGEMADLRRIGFDAKLFLGDSTSPMIVKTVQSLGPFDLVFIDGDHRYEGAKKDWQNYGPLGKVVVFHDIVQPKPGERQELGVWRLWKEIEGNKREYIADGSKMGLGVVTR